MAKRVFAALAALVGAAVALLGTAPVAAQTYPPPRNSITVDDATPVAGQSITVTLQTCRARTVALLGIDLSLVASPRVGADGVARATVTVPRRLRPGRHTVSGACLGADFLPLFLRTTIVVSAPTSGGGGAGGAGGGTGSGGTSRSGAAAAAPAGDGTAAVPSSGSATGTLGGVGGGGSDLSVLDGPTVPADAPAIFEDAAEANGVPGGGSDGAGAPGALAAPSAQAAAEDDPGPLATVARVILGVAALGGVPAALALSRRPPRVVREGFA